MENKKYKTNIPEYKKNIPKKMLRENVTRKPRGVPRDIFIELTPRQQARILIMQSTNSFYSNKVPDGFIKLETSRYTPKGYKWYVTKMSMFDKKYSRVKVLVKK